MIRFLFRFIGLWLLAGAFVTLVIDGTRSVSASSLLFVPLRDAWALVDPFGLDAIQKKATGSYEAPIGLLLATPFFAVLVLLGLLFLLIGRKRRDSRIGYSARD